MKIPRTTPGDHVTAQIDSLKRWCGARLHDRAYRAWVIFRFPETLDYWRLVDVERPRPDRPEWMIGPDARLRRRDGFTLTDQDMDRVDFVNLAARLRQNTVQEKLLSA